MKICDYYYLGLEGDDTLAFIEAVSRLSDGDTLELESRVYHFYPDNALKASVNCAVRGYEVKKCLFLLENLKDVKINGNGAELVFHGRISPFILNSCRNIEISNLSVDYASPFFSQAEIISADTKSTMLRFDEEETLCGINKGDFIFSGLYDGWHMSPDRVLALEYNKEGRRPEVNSPTYFAYTDKNLFNPLHSNLNRLVSLEKDRDGHIVMSGDFCFLHNAGNMWVCIYDNQNSVITVLGSRDVTISDVNIYHSASRGIFAKGCENIYINGARITFREGSQRFITTNSDGVRISCCRGKVSIKDSEVVSTMSTGICVKGFHGQILKIIDEKTVYICSEDAIFTNSVMRPGDTVLFANEGSGKKTNNVIADVFAVSECMLRVTLKKKLARSVREGALVENITAQSQIEILRCKIGNNRPYAVAVTSKKSITIENCNFFSMYSAVVIGNDGTNSHSYASDNVVVKDNIFSNAAYAGAYPISVKRCPGFDRHGSIAINGNTFISPEEYFLSALSASELTFGNNRYLRDEGSVAAKKGLEKAIFTEDIELSSVSFPKIITEKELYENA